MFRKNAVVEVLLNSQENVSSRAPCKKFELSIPPTYNYTENWLHRNV